MVVKLEAHMATISKKAARAAYKVAKRIREGQLSGKQGVAILVSNYGFNRNSAQTYIHDYDCMVRGQLITRTLNAFATEYYLTKFLEDGGPVALSLALSSLGQHIPYYEKTRHTRVNKLRAIYDRFRTVNDQALEFETHVRQGAGFGRPETNEKVERAAVKHVTKSYVLQGWKVRSVEREKCGFDLVCTKDRTEKHVEVKGVQGGVVSFIITRGERRKANVDPDFVLCVVTLALSRERKLWCYNAEEIESVFHFEPLAYQARLVKTLNVVD
jgi:hypothetical protein